MRQGRLTCLVLAAIGGAALGLGACDDSSLQKPLIPPTVTVTPDSLPRAEIVTVLNTYWRGGQKFSASINVHDSIPDTIPYQSWITVFVDGTPAPGADSTCTDSINWCLGYQNSWTSSSPYTGSQSVPWLPVSPEDSDSTGTQDSTSLNIGSQEYTVRARAVDDQGRSDNAPPEISLMGNFPPTLDEHYLEDCDGTKIEDGDTLFWNWWDPCNYTGSTLDTLEIIAPDIRVIKTWTLRIRGKGHDDARDPDGSGVKSWLYLFHLADNPGQAQKFARSGVWVDGQANNELSDEMQFTIRYDPIVDPGGTDAFQSLPPAIGQGYDFTMTGRDLAQLDEFRQYAILEGSRQLINVTLEAARARRTETGSLRFYLVMVR